MKKICFVLMCMLLTTMAAAAQQFVNLTPQPWQMTVGQGSYVLPRSYTVSASRLAPDVQDEAMKFIHDMRIATGCKGRITGKAGADIQMSMDAKVPREGYKLTVTEQGIKISASSPSGFFYAFPVYKEDDARQRHGRHERKAGT